jgi:serine protease Do
LGGLAALSVVSAAFYRGDLSFCKDLISWMAPTMPAVRLQWESICKSRAIMTYGASSLLNRARDCKLFSKRRLALLASVAVLAVAGLLTGPRGFSQAGVEPTLNQAPAIPPSAPLSRGTDASAVAPAQGFADLVAKVKPAVVSVRVKIVKGSNEDKNGGVNPFKQGLPFPFAPKGLQRHQIIRGEGSAFFISSDGYAVTDNHVLENAKSVQVTTDDDSVYTAKVVGTDPKTDLALIKVDANKTFLFVKFAEQQPRVGDWVLTVGNPFGLGGTVTAGIVSARGRAIDGNPYGDYMQIDAPINRGNSGGPTFDLSGDVVGVNTAIISPTGGSVGIGFDIPASVAVPVIAQLKSTGTVARGQIGVSVQSVTSEIADSLGMKTAEGALVDEARSGSPAAKAGIETGDVIRSVNDTTVKGADDLARKIAAMTPGTQVTVNVLRNGEQRTLTLTLDKMPEERQVQTETRNEKSHPTPLAELGLAVAPARESGEAGVLVTDVDPERPAGENGLKPGDIIRSVDGKAVANDADVLGAVGRAKSEGKRAVLLNVKTSEGTRFVALRIG